MENKIEEVTLLFHISRPRGMPSRHFDLSHLPIDFVMHPRLTVVHTTLSLAKRSSQRARVGVFHARRGRFIWKARQASTKVQGTGGKRQANVNFPHDVRRRIQRNNKGPPKALFFLVLSTRRSLPHDPDGLNLSREPQLTCVPLASQRITDNETRSVELLRQISTALQSGAELPDAESYAQDKSLLNFKQSQLSKSEQTAKSLDGKLARLKKDQANVDALESKIRVEMTNLEEQIETMKTGLVT
jgi:hypothetical protein